MKCLCGKGKQFDVSVLHRLGEFGQKVVPTVAREKGECEMKQGRGSNV